MCPNFVPVALISKTAQFSCQIISNTSRRHHVLRHQWRHRIQHTKNSKSAPESTYFLMRTTSIFETACVTVMNSFKHSLYISLVSSDLLNFCPKGQKRGSTQHHANFLDRLFLQSYEKHHILVDQTPLKHGLVVTQPNHCAVIIVAPTYWQQFKGKRILQINPNRVNFSPVWGI